MAHRKDRQRLWEEILGVANEDLRELEAELAEREDANEDDAYYQAFALWVEARTRLVGASDLEHVRGVCDLAARARAVLAGVLEETPCCFFDPVHGPSARPVLFAPDGGSMKRVLACSACAQALDQGRMPALRKAPVNGFPTPYWRCPAHAGYYGRDAATLDALLPDDTIGVFDWLYELIDLTVPSYMQW